MKVEQVVFPLAPVYRHKKIDFQQARAVALWPEGSADASSPAVEIKYTIDGRSGERERITYDFLINATGPNLNFAATPGLGPDGGFSLSVCTAEHADQRPPGSPRSSSGSSGASTSVWSSGWGTGCARARGRRSSSRSTSSTSCAHARAA